MKVEVVELYPAETHLPNSFEGTIHFYLPELDIDVRGVYYKFYGDTKRLLILLPGKSYIDEETGKKRIFLSVSFCTTATQKLFMNAMKRAAIEEIVKIFPALEKDLKRRPFPKKKKKFEQRPKEKIAKKDDLK